MIQHHCLAGFEVRRHGGERDGQPAEVPNGVDRPGEAGQQLGDALARHDAAREVDPCAVNRQREDIMVFGELPLDWKVPALHRVGEERVPVFGCGYGVERGGRVAGRVQAADDAAHAGAGDDVHRHAGLLEHLQDPDVGQRPRGAAAQRQADLRVPGRAGGARRLSGGQSPRQECPEREQQAAPSQGRSLKGMVSYPRERRGCHRRQALASLNPGPA